MAGLMLGAAQVSEQIGRRRTQRCRLAITRDGLFPIALFVERAGQVIEGFGEIGPKLKGAAQRSDGVVEVSP